MDSSHNSGFYRVYKSGWCEQYGTVSNVTYNPGVSITFPKTFSDTNYCFNATCKVKTNQYVNASTVLECYPYSVSEAHLFNVSSTSTDAYWYACGFITNSNS